MEEETCTEEANDAVASVENQHSCSVCKKMFAQSSSLYRHLKNIHKMTLHFPKRDLVCPLCGAVFNKDLNQLHQHLEKRHEITVVSEERTFNSNEELLDWKSKVENETCVQYVQRCGAKRKENSETTTYYCNRSGFFKSESKNKRALKVQGSNRIDANCPSRIQVVKTNLEHSDQYKVKYVCTHVGHENELAHISLSVKDKEWVASLLLKGVDMDKILNEVRDSLSGQLKRIHLLDRKDLLNIEAAYHINANRCSNDRQSVESWIDCMQSNGDSCILLHKAQGIILDDYPQLSKDDFFLAIMNESQKEMLIQYGPKCISLDTTHGLNIYGFDLTTMLVLDDMNSGYPVAFLFSSRQDIPTLAAFFKVVRDRTGVITTKTLMTDDTETFFQAWSQVTGTVCNRLLCTWHVDHSWRRNLCKISNKEKQISVYKLLRTGTENRQRCIFQNDEEFYIAT